MVDVINDCDDRRAEAVLCLETTRCSGYKSVWQQGIDEWSPGQRNVGAYG